jgi:Asp-tRNA(Asn)/Glu-tRNA(Gln) amidotransferase C subunit
MVSADLPKPELLKSLTSEIVRLNDEQVEALQRAAFVGMTDDEAEGFDRRAARIADLVRKLSIIRGGPHQEKTKSERSCR